VDIYNSTIPSRLVTADTEPVTPESRQRWFTEHAPESRPLWVVDDHGIVCGWVSFQSFYGRPAYQATAEISIYLHANYRRQGLDRFLLQRALDASPTLQIKTLLGFIFGHNIPSLALFERLGFQRWAHLPQIAELDGIARDLVILGKRLDV
jgi:phosphinothricin acetyltransferase